MHQLFNQKLSRQPFRSLLTQIEKVHIHSTRQQNKSNYFLPRVDKTADPKKLLYRKVKISNELSEELKSVSFTKFKNSTKKYYEINIEVLLIKL